jgi:uncharacterized protein with GYD domain
MPLYLTRFSYTPATWAKLIKNPEDRRAAAKQYIEAVGGKMHFGDHDAYNLWEAPDNVSMAATAIAISELPTTHRPSIRYQTLSRHPRSRGAALPTVPTAHYFSRIRSVETHSSHTGSKAS